MTSVELERLLDLALQELKGEQDAEHVSFEEFKEEWIYQNSEDGRERENVADITMCKGKSCTIKEDCYRYTAKANEYRQSYFVETPCTKKMGGTACDQFWPNRRNETQEKED